MYDKRGFFPPHIFNRVHTQQQNSRKVTKNVLFLIVMFLKIELILWPVGVSGLGCIDGESGRTNEMGGRGLRGTRSMVFSNINEVKSHVPPWCILVSV